ncbi:MAG: iron ABC transporter permease [bacterium]
MGISTSEIKDLYFRFTARKILFILASIGAVIGMGLIACTIGTIQIEINDIASAILAKIFPFANIETSEFTEDIIWDIRLPRIIMAIIAGAGFAISGAVMQGITRNPLVSPFTIGVSSAAAFGASIAIVLGFSLLGSEKYIVVTNAFIFALISAFLVLGLARMRGITGETLILAGIALMYLFSAFTSILQYIATEKQLQAVIHWTFGSLTGSSWNDVLVVSIIFFFCFPFLMKHSWDLNAISGGDEVAKSLGVNLPQVRIICLILATIITAGIICFTGIIGFVCLVTPHIARLLIGADHRFLLPFSCILGALLLLIADTIGRNIISPVIIPVGIVTSIIGVPFFVYLLITRRKEYWT